MPLCKRPSCRSNVLKGSPSYFICSGPSGCGKPFHISCARLYVLTIASANCCRTAIKTFDSKQGPSNTSAALDKNRPLLNSTTILSEDSLLNTSNMQIDSSSPNLNSSQINSQSIHQILNTPRSSSQPNIEQQIQPQHALQPVIINNSTPVTTLASLTTMSASSSVVTTFTNTIVSTPLPTMIHSAINQNPQGIPPTPAINTNNHAKTSSLIRPFGPPIMYPLNDELRIPDTNHSTTNH